MAKGKSDPGAEDDEVSEGDLDNSVVKIVSTTGGIELCGTEAINPSMINGKSEVPNNNIVNVLSTAGKKRDHPCRSPCCSTGADSSHHHRRRRRLMSRCVASAAGIEFSGTEAINQSMANGNSEVRNDSIV